VKVCILYNILVYYILRFYYILISETHIKFAYVNIGKQV